MKAAAIVLAFGTGRAGAWTSSSAPSFATLGARLPRRRNRSPTAGLARSMPGIGDLRPDQPISLKAVCEIIFEGSITPVTLKAEHRRRTLELFKIGRAHFATRWHVEAMMEQCRLQSRPSVSRGALPDNLRKEARRRASLAALKLIIERLKVARKKR